MESTAPRRSLGLLGGRGDDGGDSSTVSKLNDTFFFTPFPLAQIFGFAPPFILGVSFISFTSQLLVTVEHTVGESGDFAVVLATVVAAVEADESTEPLTDDWTAEDAIVDVQTICFTMLMWKSVLHCSVKH